MVHERCCPPWRYGGGETGLLAAEETENVDAAQAEFHLAERELAATRAMRTAVNVMCLRK